MMRFTEAMRLGAMTTDRLEGGLTASNATGQIVATCGLGAAIVGAGLPCHVAAEGENGTDGRGRPTIPGVSVVYDVPMDWQYLLASPVQCPAECCPLAALSVPGSLMQVIAHLNDWHGWTREQIAAFVDPIERDFEVRAAIVRIVSELEPAVRGEEAAVP